MAARSRCRVAGREVNEEEREEDDPQDGRHQLEQPPREEARRHGPQRAVAAKCAPRRNPLHRVRCARVAAVSMSER